MDSRPATTLPARMSSAPGISGGGSSSTARPKHARQKSMTDPGEVYKQLLKQLAKHAHQTSSQFVLIWCDSKGNTHPTTSNAFQGYLDKWIAPDVWVEAKQIAISAADEKKVRRKRDSGMDKKVQQERRLEPGDGEWANDEHHVSHAKSMSHAEMMLHATDPLVGDMDAHMKKRPSQDDTVAMSRKRKTVPRPEAIPRRSSSESDDYVDNVGEEQEYIQLHLADQNAVTTFYMTRLRQMQQLMCKVVAKAWIKVIEPKKQSNFPYNGGNDTRPSWWPQTVRHKEPDHLMKPERLTLLLTMLRSRKVPISKLESATAEVMVQIPKERIPLLDEVYHVAKQEERYERNELPPDTVAFVAASERIIRRGSSAKAVSPDTRRRSVASPMHGSVPDRRMSVQSSEQSDMTDSQEMDMRDPSRMGNRDESTMQHSQPPHNPFSVSNAPPANLNIAIDYSASYVQPPLLQTSPIQDQQQFMGDSLAMRNSIQEFYLVNRQPSIPMLRRNNTMPAAPQQPSPGPVHHSWSPQIPMYTPYSPGTPSGHTPYGPPPRHSVSNPPTPVTAASFQGMQLPPPPPPQGHQQAQILHQQPQLGHPQMGHRPSHHNVGPAGEGSNNVYDTSGSMETQIGPNTHTNNLGGFTDFLRSDLPSDGNGRVKME